MYVLDTDHLGILQSPQSKERSHLLQRIAMHAPIEFCTSIISFHEEVQGWFAYVHSARTPGRLIRGYLMFENVLRNFAAMQVLSFDETAAERFASLKAMKLGVGTMDLRIAAIALAHDACVLTRNFVDFQKIPDLRVEDWSVPLT